MKAFTIAETLHRLVKQAIDSGIAANVEEAEALFRGYRLCFSIEAAEACHPNHQAALLTGIALARRVFLGGVTVVGNLDVPLRVPLPLGHTLQEAALALGAQYGQSEITDLPCVFIGGTPRVRGESFRVRAVFAGWRGGVIPAHSEFPFSEEGTMSLAPMLASALAVSEAFFHVQGRTPVAGRRSVGLSLWQPSRTHWLEGNEEAPRLQYLPSSLWLIGLGHLGQAYLWALGLLPYPEPTGVSLVLQDVDVITPSTESTSILSTSSMIDVKKTRAMAEWAERRGFKTAIIERLFDASFTRNDNEPAIALCGLDNSLGRRALDQVGFPFVVEAGLGRGHRDFQSIRVHTLPGSRSAAEIWKFAFEKEDLADRAAYRKMLNDGDLDRCGVTLLSGKAVGAPFVGAVAACLAISEVLRLLHGGPLNQLIDLDLQSPDHRTIVRQISDFGNLNPGYVRASTGSSFF
ncbi:MAG: thiamine biosynthesis protein ThiF [Nitrospirae bacterium]|nr:thiamine biosynthesis protein ThiF [Candidatus Manganitrophaceae bacterium]